MVEGGDRAPDDVSPDVCPGCGRPFDARRAVCADCGLEDVSGRPEPFGWRYIHAGTVEATAPNGTTLKLPRRTLVCNECYRRRTGGAA